MAEVEATTELLIRRKRSEVAEFMFHPVHETEWRMEITESTALQDGPYRTGDRVRGTVTFLGYRFNFRYQVTDHVPGRMVELTVDRPFPLVVRYELESTEEGTTVSIRAVGTPGPFFGWATPLLRRKATAALTADLHRLRDRLEHRSW